MLSGALGPSGGGFVAGAVRVTLRQTALDDPPGAKQGYVGDGGGCVVILGDPLEVTDRDLIRKVFFSRRDYSLNPILRHNS